MTTAEREPVEISRFGITVLFEDEESKVDVVFIHGLDGNPKDTWAYKKFHWPTQIGTKIPGLRVMTFGYNADITPQFSTNLASIRSIAQSLLGELANERREPNELNRPLIFVAHSLGGLVTKQALIEASKTLQTHNDDHDCIYNATKGLMFFGVPNAGSTADQTRRARWLTAAGSIAATQVPPMLKQALTIHSPELLGLAEDFRRLSLCLEEKIAIYTFFETVTISLLGDVPLVDDYSARVGYNRETPLPIAHDHINMVKFSGAADSNFKNVIGKLKYLKRFALEAANVNAATAPVPDPIANTNSFAAPARQLQIEANTFLPALDHEEQATLNQQLVSATSEGRLAKVKELIDSGGDVNAQNDSLREPTPLRAATACYKSCKDALALFDSPSMRVQIENWSKIVMFLLEKGANPDVLPADRRLLVREIRKRNNALREGPS